MSDQSNNGVIFFFFFSFLDEGIDVVGEIWQVEVVWI